jgi:hypothetical protein
VAINEVVNGVFNIPKGEMHFFALVSVRDEESTKTLLQLKNYLSLLRIAYTAEGGVVRLTDLPRGFRVLAANIGAVSGFRCIGYLADELSKWWNSTLNVNPAFEVVSSLNAMCVTHPYAKKMLFSSPMGRLDFHAAMFDRGNEPGQIISHATSWDANPIVSIESTRKEEPNEDRWRREYAAVPMEGTEESLISPASIDACTRTGSLTIPREEGVSYVAAMDPAMRGNGWTLGIMGRRMVGDAARRCLVHCREWRGSSSQPLDPRAVLAEVRTELQAYGLNAIWTDQREYDSLRAIGEGLGLILQQDVMTAQLKEERAVALERALATHDLELPEHPVLRADLLGIVRVMTATGLHTRLTDTPDGRHCDYAAMLMLLVGKYCDGPIVPETRTPALVEQEQALKRTLERYGQRSTGRGRTRTPGSDGQFGRGY